MILYYTILYYTILYYTILYYTILYYTILYSTILVPIDSPSVPWQSPASCTGSRRCRPSSSASGLGVHGLARDTPKAALKTPTDDIDIAIDVDTDIDINSKKLEHIRGMIYATVPFFLVWGWRTVMFQLFGFYRRTFLPPVEAVDLASLIFGSSSDLRSWLRNWPYGACRGFL